MLIVISCVATVALFPLLVLWSNLRASNRVGIWVGEYWTAYKPGKTNLDPTIVRMKMINYDPIVSPEKVDPLSHPGVHGDQFWIYNPMTGNTIRRYNAEDAIKEWEVQSEHSQHPICLFRMIGFMVQGEKHFTENSPLKVENDGRELKALEAENIKLQVQLEVLTKRVTELIVEGV
jgi:hypothetical protein